jgi:hypothetical protein
MAAAAILDFEMQKKAGLIASTVTCLAFRALVSENPLIQRNLLTNA